MIAAKAADGRGINFGTIIDTGAYQTLLKIGGLPKAAPLLVRQRCFSHARGVFLITCRAKGGEKRAGDITPFQLILAAVELNINFGTVNRTNDAVPRVGTSLARSTT